MLIASNLSMNYSTMVGLQRLKENPCLEALWIQVDTGYRPNIEDGIANLVITE